MSAHGSRSEVRNARLPESWTGQHGQQVGRATRPLSELDPEVWDTQQFERVGVPLGEQVVHFRVVFVIGHAVVRDAVC